MKIGTRSILFGVHCWFIHPLIVAIAWWQLYGFPWDPRLWVAFFVHDWGYWGCPNMDGSEGEWHIHLGAKIMGYLFDDNPLKCGPEWLSALLNRMNSRPYQGQKHPNHASWFCFCFYHSRFIAKKYGVSYSRLCVADKLAIAYTPWWLYIAQAWLSGELFEYMEGKGARTPAGQISPRKWLSDVQRYCRAWAFEHRDGKEDTWTGTKRELQALNDVSKVP